MRTKVERLKKAQALRKTLTDWDPEFDDDPLGTVKGVLVETMKLLIELETAAVTYPTQSADDGAG